MNYDFNEAIHLLKQAFPALLAFLLQYALQAFSVTALGHMGSTELAALALGSMYAAVTVWSIGFGFTLALDTLFPQSFSSRRPKLIGIYLQRAIIIILVGIVPFAVITWWNAGTILGFLGQNVELSMKSEIYLRYLLLGVPPCLIFWCIEKYLQAQGIMKATTYILMFCCPISLILNYVLVLWEPIALGFIGAPIAISITNWLMMICSIFYVKYVDGSEGWGGWSSESLQDWSPLLKLAVPGILTSLADWWVYEFLALAAGYLGNLPLAGHRLILTIALLLYQLPHSISISTSNRIGNFLGAKLANKARVTANSSLVLAVLGAAFNSTLLLMFSDSLGYLFTNDGEVVSLVSTVLPYCVLLQISDGLGVVGSGILRGQGRQDIVATIYLTSYYLIGMPLSLILAFRFSYGLKGLWIGVIVGSLIMGLGLVLAVITTDWQLEVKKCQKRISREELKEREGGRRGASSCGINFYLEYLEYLEYI
ncbi:2979_t:CDS:2 [Entrophospora sp. SA101]|nr:1535_t:CDS:2 [Entrophospora sp. SA101]CAJ0884418.1 2979_t:CDS:2 [Entrophospora sp. SA101]CAJ0926199.1 18291_t:CDS:2 [Entrophospora sp. SA101]